MYALLRRKVPRGGLRNINLRASYYCPQGVETKSIVTD